MVPVTRPGSCTFFRPCPAAAGTAAAAAAAKGAATSSTVAQAASVPRTPRRLRVA